MGIKTYSVGKTIVKAAEVPALVIVGGKLLPSVVSHVGITVDEETSVAILSTLYGVIRGFSNWIKNRKNGKG